MPADYNSVEKRQMGDASALLNIAQRIGGALGAILVVALIHADASSMGRDAYTGAFAVILGISLVAVIPAGFLIAHCKRG
jgi:sugar phosphate permease